jgi:membrane protein required for colicin V production
MTGLDYLILAVVLLSAIAGLVRGFLKEVCSLVTWFAAVWLAWQFGPSLEPYMGGALREPPFGLWAGRAVVFIAVLIVGAIIGALISYFVRLSLFSGLDRFLGFLLGVARGVVILGVLMILGQSVRLDSEGWWERSKLVKQIQPVASLLRSITGERQFDPNR